MIRINGPEEASRRKADSKQHPAHQRNTVATCVAAKPFCYLPRFRIWKDADPDIPILIAAKSEYAKLK